jgi:hypothetical protein|tara:strand:- start:2569 stop:2790 length:222 start_codon:yes stop_codon:yes gene_type:complete
MREAETLLSELKVILNTKGNIEVEYNNVPSEDFIEAMNKKLPEYENTHIIAAFMKRVRRLSLTYYNDVNKLLL